jgi:hypothetical protein
MSTPASVKSDSSLALRAAQTEALEQDYPPSAQQLTQDVAALYDIKDELEDVQTHIKRKRRPGHPDPAKQKAELAELEAKRGELQRLLRRGADGAPRLDKRVMRERARLYALAQAHFPELLAQGSPWLERIGFCTPVAGLQQLKEQGLWAAGRAMATFVDAAAVRREGEPSAGRRVLRAVDDEGTAWAVKQFDLAEVYEQERFYRHIGILHDLRHPNLAAVAAVFEDEGKGACRCLGTRAETWRSGWPRIRRPRGRCRSVRSSCRTSPPGWRTCTRTGTSTATSSPATSSSLGRSATPSWATSIPCAPPTPTPPH